LLLLICIQIYVTGMNFPVCCVCYFTPAHRCAIKMLSSDCINERADWRIQLKNKKTLKLRPVSPHLGSLHSFTAHTHLIPLLIYSFCNRALWFPWNMKNGVIKMEFTDGILESSELWLIHYYCTLQCTSQSNNNSKMIVVAIVRVIIQLL